MMQVEPEPLGAVVEPWDQATGPVLIGRHTGLLRVHDRVTVLGEVADGASLAWGAVLEVVGTFRGVAHLSPGATLRVRGSYEGERVGRDGSVLIAGRCTLDAAQRPGTSVEVGTVVVTGRRDAWTLAEDGSLVRLLVDRQHALGSRSARPALRWSDKAQRFTGP